MDHAINALSQFLSPELDMLRREWKNGKGGYKKLSVCPSYGTCKALVNAIHILEKCEYGKAKTMSVKDLIAG
ncbi:MAG: hypothetical protein K0Q73_7609 [Paenibacillus sp.]|jgi:hypothetical protein|nr:hypothetical protein [Paenibacillus sp.]